MSRAAYLARLERERLVRAEQQGRARRAAREVEEGVAESMALSRARGVPLAHRAIRVCFARVLPFR